MASAAAATGLPMLGIDLGGTKIEARLLAPDGSERWRHRVPTPRNDYRATLRALSALVAQAAEAEAATAAAVSAAALPFTIGIGTPGTPTAAGAMKNCNSTWLNGQPLQRDLQALIDEQFGRPMGSAGANPNHPAIALANDADCLALSEATDGAGAGATVVFAAILGTGVGAGIVVDGRLLRGPNRIAGEWGHNPLPWAADEPAAVPDPQPRCWCGQRGCIESLVSGPALALDHAAAAPLAFPPAPTSVRATNRPDAATIAARAAAGDPFALATLDRHASRLARALAAVINLLDPDVIVLGGGLSRMPHLTARVPTLWGRWVFGAQAEPVRTRLLPALHGDASGVRGAAWLGRALR